MLPCGSPLEKPVNLIKNLKTPHTRETVLLTCLDNSFNTKILKNIKDLSIMFHMLFVTCHQHIVLCRAVKETWIVVVV